MSRTVAVDLRALVPEPTGIGVYTLEMLRALSARGGFDYVGLAHREPRGARELAALGVALEHRRAPLGVLWQQALLPRRLAAGDLDLLWSPLQTLPRSSPVPAVVTVHDLTVLLMPDVHRAKVRWSQVPFLQRSFQTARRVVAVSESTARDLRFHFPEAFARDADKLRVVPEGVSEDFRPAGDAERRAIREEIGCPGGYLLYAGTLEPRKNVAALLDAWLALRAQDAGAPPLVLAGGYGWRSRGLVRRIERLRAHPDLRGELHVLGRVDRSLLLRLFRAATVFAYPSHYEGFGLPVVEAMASGVPVVTSDVSSLPEVLGDAGLTARPEEPGAIAGAVRKILDDPPLARELAARGLERARRFRWDVAAERMEEVFEEALG
ncbi:MAG: glycosyltransferase family 1 protein [Acidobacteriota bacterium]